MKTFLPYRPGITERSAVLALRRAWRRSALWGTATLLFFSTVAAAQRIEARGSLDAIKVVTPEATTQPADLPPSHPQISGNDLPGHPQGMQTVKTGAIRVLFSQGTADAPALGQDPVTVQLFAKGNVLQSYQTHIDDKGAVEIGELPLDVPFQPIITVTHAGAEQQLVGPPMHKYQPAIELEMKVYELTTEKPAWTIGLRHILVEPVVVNGRMVLHVTEMIGGFNPSPRAWTGQVSELAPETATLTIPLPPLAANVEFGPGLAEAGAHVVNHAVIRGKTMLPGSAQYVLGYLLPVEGGKATLTFATPADTTLFALYIPAETHVDKAEGLDVAKASGTNADQGRQLLKARALKSGQVLRVELSSIALPRVAPAAPSINDIPNGLHLPAAHPGTLPSSTENKP